MLFSELSFPYFESFQCFDLLHQRIGKSSYQCNIFTSNKHAADQNRYCFILCFFLLICFYLLSTLFQNNSDSVVYFPPIIFVLIKIFFTNCFAHCFGNNWLTIKSIPSPLFSFSKNTFLLAGICEGAFN